MVINTKDFDVQYDIETVQDFSPKTSYDDAFFIDKEIKCITWIYYNPDSVAGGQYVINSLCFDDIKKAMQKHNYVDDFFDYLGEIAYQELADIGTTWFKDAENQFLKQPDFTGCDEDTMRSLVAIAYEDNIIN